MGVSESVSIKAMRVIINNCSALRLTKLPKMSCVLGKIARSIEISPRAMKAVNRIEL